MLFWIIFALCILATVVYTAKRGPKVEPSDLAFKCVACLMFIAVGLTAVMSNPVNLTYGLLVVFGSVLGLVGDVFIELKAMYPQNMKSHLNFGFAFFMLEHVVLVAATLITYPMKLMNFLICLIAPLVVFAVSKIAGKIMKLNMGEFEAISYIYGALASMTFSVGFMTLTTYGFALSQILFFIGGVLFFGSDMVLSMIFFADGKNTKFFTVANHILYFGAQISLATSLFFLK